MRYKLTIVRKRSELWDEKSQLPFSRDLNKNKNKNKYMIYTIFGYTNVKREIPMWKSQIHNTQTHYILNKQINKIKNTSFRHTSVFLSLNKILSWINKKRNRSPSGTVTALFLSWKYYSISEKWSSMSDTVQMFKSASKRYIYWWAKENWLKCAWASYARK